jgi:predicted naringenin-chalcone synthase
MQIQQISTATPKGEYSTEELTKLFPSKLPQGVQQNILNLGVEKRYLISHPNPQLKQEEILSEKELVNLCTEASKKAIEKANLSIKDIGFFIMAYDVNPILCPGLSQRLIREIGFDPYIKYVNTQGMACGALTNALRLAENHLAAHSDDFVLLCISGVNSYWFHNQVQGIRDIMEIGQINKIKDENKRRMELRKWIATMEFFLFGDGVASVIVAKDAKGLTVKRIEEVTNLGKKDYVAGYARLAALNEPFKFGFVSHLGREIPELGVKYTSVALERLFGKNAESVTKTVKKWAIHTGSEKLLDTIAAHNQIPREKVKESYDVLREYGNLAGASIPFILEKILAEEKMAKGDVAVLLGYGWGFSASAAMLEFMK